MCQGAACYQGQRQDRSRVLGDLQAFPMWLEGREASSEAGEIGRGWKSPMCPAREFGLILQAVGSH